MPRETQGLVETVSAFARQSARKRQFVAACLAAFRPRVFHHRLADAFPLMRRQNRDIFDHAAACAALRQIVQDNERVGRGHFAIDYRYEETITRILAQSRKLLPRFIQRERQPAADSGLTVGAENCGEVLFDRLPNEHL